jgi:hypothetical protein
VQQFQDGGDVDAGFGSNVEYTYSTFLAENNLNDTPQAREMFARYKSLMDTREPLTDPQLFSSVGFDRAPAALGDAPTTTGVEFDPDRAYSSQDESRFFNPYYSLGRPMNAGLKRMGFGNYYDTGPQLPEGTDAAFIRQTSPAAPVAPQSTLDQLRSSVYSTNPLEDALAGTGLDSNVIGTSVIDPVISRLDQAASREGMPSPTAADIANETALRNRELASENAGRLPAEELMSSDPVRPGAAPELTAEELAMQAYAESLAQQYAPVGEELQIMDDATSEFLQRLVTPKVGSKAVTFPGAEGRAIIRGDLTAADMMPPPPRALDLPAEERRMDYVTEGETPVVEAPASDTSPATDTDAAAPVVTEDVAKKVADPKIQEEAAALAPAPGDTEDDLRTKYEARAKLFREILGEDEAGARNKGMDLAMIGLAIMSGQSPNALTNIALGGAAGLKAMSARDEAARERQRLVRTAALESVLEEEAADKVAIATAADKEADRLNRLAAARISAGKTTTQAAARNLANIGNDASVAAAEIYNDPVKRAVSDVKMDKDGKTPLETERQYIARKSIERVTLAHVLNPEVYGTSPLIQSSVDELLKKNDKSLVKSELLRKYPGINPADYGL